MTAGPSSAAFIARVEGELRRLGMRCERRCAGCGIALGRFEAHLSVDGERFHPRCAPELAVPAPDASEPLGIGAA